MFETRIDDRVIINRATGPFSIAQLLDFVRENNRAWGQSPVLWDCTHASLAEGVETHSQIREMMIPMRALAEYRGNARAAFVVANDFDFGMLSMLSMIAAMLEFPVEMRVFREMQEARTWATNLS